jgi:ribosomal protein S27AE
LTAKKATQLDKGNKHPYHGKTVYFGTKHEKARVIAPLLSSLNIAVETVAVDTDQFGTFTGEIERKGTVRETLRRKIEAVLLEKPFAELVLASEGSFGSHPHIGFIQSNHESLLLYDKTNDLEIYVDELSTETNHNQIEFGPRDDLQKFLDQIDFPSHAVIVRPKGVSGQVFKGLDKLPDLGQAIIESFQASPEAKVILSTDMRACFNPTRMKTIKSAGEKLVKKITSFCPSCSAIGFWPVRANQGLECSDCGLPTAAAKDLVWECSKCLAQETRDREDGLKFCDPSECDYCNP